jgi:release factor glutamine methyltransferase
MIRVSQPKTTPWTIGRLLSWTADFLGRHEVDDPRLSAEVLLAHAAGCRRIDLYARFDRVLEEAPLADFRDLVKRAGTHEPIAHLVGEKEFFSLRFRVSADVLVPRAETEELVEAVLDLCIQQAWESPRLWDLGTGSGCLPVAILMNLPAATCLATDVSASALEIARANAERHHVADRVNFVQTSGFDVPTEAISEGGFHLILSNPPYIPAAAIATLDRAVRDFEPRAALTDEADGLSFYRMIADESSRFLVDGGYVVVEVGDGAASAVSQIMTGGDFVHVRTRKDRTVGKERVLVFRRREPSS